MQTFLPYPSFAKSAKVLDNQRLGKQRVEVYQLLGAITGRKLMTKVPDTKIDLPQDEWQFSPYATRSWSNHPAAVMWRGHEKSLISYGNEICLQWLSRGFNDTCLAKIERFLDMIPDDYGMPPWIGDKDFHRSHKSNLVRKKPEYYRQFFPNVPDNLEYIWPDGIREGVSYDIEGD